MIRDLGSWPPGTLVMYPFRYYDAVRGKWVKARYVAEFPEIAARHANFELLGPPERRTPGGGHFATPVRSQTS